MFKIENIHHRIHNDEIYSVRLVTDHGDKVTMDIELYHKQKECRVYIKEGLIQGFAVLKGTFK